LTVTVTMRAEAAHVLAIAQSKHLNASIDATIMNNDITIEGDGNATWVPQLFGAGALIAERSHKRPVDVIEQLHPMVVTIDNNEMTEAIESNASWILKLPPPSA